MFIHRIGQSSFPVSPRVIVKLLDISGSPLFNLLGGVTVAVIKSDVYGRSFPRSASVPTAVGTD